MIPRPSSSVILIAPTKYLKPSAKQLANGISTAFDYKIFMVKRNAQTAFASAHVFPGGVIDAVDSEVANKIVKRGAEAAVHADADYRVGAIREVFEEIGLPLFVKRGSTSSSPNQKEEVVVFQSDEELAEWRDKIHSNSASLLDFCIKYQCAPDVDSLQPFCMWTTPVAEKKRYKTMFYVTNTEKYFESNSKQMESMRHDGVEITKSKWLNPLETLAHFASSKIYLAPPTWCMLRELAAFPRMQDLLSFLKQRQLQHQVPHNHPRMLFAKDLQEDPIEVEFYKQQVPRMIVTLPGDRLFQAQEEEQAHLNNNMTATTDSRHRMESYGTNDYRWVEGQTIIHSSSFALSSKL